MDTQADTGAPAPEAPPIVDDGGNLTASEAGRLLAQQRYSKPAEIAPERAAPAVQESPAQAEDAAPPQEATGEPEQVDPPETAPLDPPRSWSKEQHDHWSKLDPEVQSYLLEQDSKASAEVRRAQNEAAEKAKEYQAEADKAKLERQKYETSLPVVMQQLGQHLLAEFPDVRNQQDVDRLAREEPGRWVLFNQRMTHLKAVGDEIAQAQQRQVSEQQESTAKFIDEQNKLFDEKVPAAEAKELKDKAPAFLEERGFTKKDIANWSTMSPWDHRFQLIIRDAMKWQQAQASRKNLTSHKAPVPPVQRPGTARPAGADNAAEIQRLEKQLGSNSNLTSRQQAEVAHQLLQLARRKAS